MAADGRSLAEIASAVVALVRINRVPLLFLPANHANERESMRLVSMEQALRLVLLFEYYNAQRNPRAAPYENPKLR